jgi:hypothetical protein
MGAPRAGVPAAGRCAGELARASGPADGPLAGEFARAATLALPPTALSLGSSPDDRVPAPAPPL